MKTCNDCLYHDLCNEFNGTFEDMTCVFFKDKSLFIELPCPLGTTVYRICRKKYDVDGYGMQWEEDWGIVTNAFNLGMFHEIGVNVFLTVEEAEAALKQKE